MSRPPDPSCMGKITVFHFVKSMMLPFVQANCPYGVFSSTAYFLISTFCFHASLLVLTLLSCANGVKWDFPNKSPCCWLVLSPNRSQDGAGPVAPDRKSLTLPVSRNRAGILHARLQQLGALENAHTFNNSEPLSLSFTGDSYRTNRGSTCTARNASRGSSNTLWKACFGNLK